MRPESPQEPTCIARQGSDGGITLTTHTPDIQALLNGLQRLERQNRRIKKVGLSVLGAVGALALMAQGAGHDARRPSWFRHRGHGLV
jgi:hypothetical protein